MRVTSGVLAVAAGLSACVPCAPDRLDDAPSARPGEVRHGVALGAGDFVNITGTPGGVACVICGGILYFDDALREQRRVEVAFSGEPRDVLIAASSDTTLVLDRDPGTESDIDAGATRPRHFQLFALSPAGDELWRNDLGMGDPQDPSMPLLAAGPASVVVHSRSSARVFDPATGALRYSTPVAFGDAIAPDATGGLYVGGSAFGFDQRPARATVRYLQASGAERWTATWTVEAAALPLTPFLSCSAVAPGQDGGFVVAVHVTGTTLDLGERKLVGPDPEINTFLVALDRDGRVQWTIAIGNAAIVRPQIAAVPDGALLAGEYAGTGAGLGLPGSDGPDSFVARVDRDGHITAHAIGGPGYQGLFALAAAADGSANVLVLNTTHDGVAGVMRVGDRTFDDGNSRQLYLLNIPL